MQQTVTRWSLADDMFQAMTDDLIRVGKLKWARNISRATPHEHLLKGIDFRIDAIAKNPGGSLLEFPLLIHVESSFNGALEFCKHGAPGIHWLVVQPNIKPNELRNALYVVYMKEIKRLRPTQPSA